MLKTATSFLATVLGIAVTFGVSKAKDKSSERNLRQQSVFSVLTDLDNAITYVQKRCCTMRFIL